MRLLAVITGCYGFAGVALGAFGAHGLRDKVAPHLFDVWQTAVQYQMFHVLALLAVLMMAVQQPENRKLRVAAALFVIGICIFSGSLYALVLTGITVLGAITPVGGVLLLLGWLVLILGLVSFVSSGR